MSEALKIAVADDEPEILEDLVETLVAMGHQVVASARNGRELVERCRAARPDLIITDIKMPDMDGLDAAAQICREQPVPIILVSAYSDPEFIERALENHVLAYLIKPIHDDNLRTSIALAMRRFQELTALRHQTDDLRQAMEDRKLVERAKGILMKRGGLEEQDAFRRLQRLASEKNMKLVEIARTILTAEQAFMPTGDD